MSWKYGGLVVALLIGVISGAVWAQEDLDRDPASISPAVNASVISTPVFAKPYPGGADEEDLKVLSTFPDAPLSTDSRSIQKDVYKDLYKQDLKDERADTVEE